MEYIVQFWYNFWFAWDSKHTFSIPRKASRHLVFHNSAFLFTNKDSPTWLLRGSSCDYIYHSSRNMNKIWWILQIHTYGVCSFLLHGTVLIFHKIIKQNFVVSATGNYTSTYLYKNQKNDGNIKKISNPYNLPFLLHK